MGSKNVPENYCGVVGMGKLPRTTVFPDGSVGFFWITSGTIWAKLHSLARQHEGRHTRFDRSPEIKYGQQVTELGVPPLQQNRPQ
jgi:hypothetical protein